MSKLQGIFVCAALLWLCALPSTGLAQDQVLYNGKIFTADAEHPYAEAVAIQGDKITAVGNRKEVSAAASADARH